MYQILYFEVNLANKMQCKQSLNRTMRGENCCHVSLWEGVMVGGGGGGGIDVYVRAYSVVFCIEMNEIFCISKET